MNVTEAKAAQQLATALLPHAATLGPDVRDHMVALLRPAYKRMLAGHVPSHYAREWDQNTPAEPADGPVTLIGDHARELARPGSYINEHGDTNDVTIGDYTQVALNPTGGTAGQVVIVNGRGQYFAAVTENLRAPFPYVDTVDFHPVAQCTEERVVYLPPVLEPPF